MSSCARSRSSYVRPSRRARLAGWLDRHAAVWSHACVGVAGVCAGLLVWVVCGG